MCLVKRTWNLGTSLNQPSKFDKLVFELQDGKAHLLIVFSLSDEVFYEVSQEQTTFGSWLKMDKLFMTKSICNKLIMKKLLLGLQMREGTLLKEHLGELNFVLMELCDIDVKIEDEDLAMILLASLLLSYENFVSSHSVGKDSNTLEEFKSNIYSRELILKAFRNGDVTSNFVLSVTDSAKGRKKKKKGKGN